MTLRSPIHRWASQHWSMSLRPWVFLFLLSACATPGIGRAPAFPIPPLDVRGNSLDAKAALALAPPRDILALDEEMKAMLDRRVRPISRKEERVQRIHWLIRNPDTLGIRYERSATTTAREAFKRRKANCLGFANLFVAMARYVGINARFQEVRVRPNWRREGSLVSVSRHINVTGALPGGTRYTADMRPVRANDTPHARAISDRRAFAQYYNNLAMGFLVKGKIDQAFSHSIRAIAFDSSLDFLWTNLGAIYSHNRQFAAAERAYLHAMELNDDSESTMNNLVALYTKMGNQKAASHYRDRVQAYQEKSRIELAHALSHLKKARAAKP